MKSLADWKTLFEIKRLERLAGQFESLLLETGTRYSVEVNFRSDMKEVIGHFSKLVLGYVMAAMKQHNYHVKHVFTQKPYRILISSRMWDDGEWVGIVSYNEDHGCFVWTDGVFNKMRGTASYKPESSQKCVGTSAAEICREVLNKMHALKNKTPRDGERLKPALRKRGPRK